MIGLRIILQGDNCWPDLVHKAKSGKLIHTTEQLQVAALEGGMQSGKPSVAIRIDLEDGSTVIAETSMALFLGAARAFMAKYGDRL